MLCQQRMGGAVRAKGCSPPCKPLPTQASKVETRQEGRGRCKGQGRRVFALTPPSTCTGEHESSSKEAQASRTTCFSKPQVGSSILTRMSQAIRQPPPAGVSREQPSRTTCCVGTLRLGASAASHQTSGTRTFPQPSWQQTAPPRAAAATPTCSHALEQLQKRLFPLSTACSVCPGADQAAEDQLQAGQRGSKGPVGAQGLRVCTFLLFSSSPPARSAAAATKKSPSARVVKKQAFILHVLLTVTAWRHSLAKVIMKQIKSQTQASLFPTPKRVNIVQNSIYRENSQKRRVQKTPLPFRRKCKTSVTVTPSTQPASHWLLPGLV